MLRFMRSVLVLGGLLAVNPSVFAEGKPAKPAPVPTPGWQASPDDAIRNWKIYPDPRARFAQGTPSDQAKDTKEDFVGELIAILNETHSPDAFLVTLSIMQEIKPEARVVVPAIIRNAERLRLFKRTDPDQPTEQQKMIVECIAVLLKKDTDSSANAAAILRDAEYLRRAAAAIEAGGHPAESLPPPVEERPAGDPLLGTSGGETKPASDAVVPGKVKSRPGFVK